LYLGDTEYILVSVRNARGTFVVRRTYVRTARARGLQPTVLFYWLASKTQTHHYSHDDDARARGCIAFMVAALTLLWHQISMDPSIGRPNPPEQWVRGAVPVRIYVLRMWHRRPVDPASERAVPAGRARPDGGSYRLHAQQYSTYENPEASVTADGSDPPAGT
jgi:hypothetical protein